MTTATIPALLMEGVTCSSRNSGSLNDFSILVEPGTFHGLIGAPGSGKSLVMDLAVGFRRPDRGRVQVLGLSPTPRQTELLRRIGIQSQRVGFLPRLTVREHLRSVAEIFGSPLRDVDILIEALLLDSAVDTRVDAITASEGQRLAVASAVVHRPEILFLDEPTANLDQESRRNLVSLLRSSNIIGTTTLYATCHLDEVEYLCDAVTVMDRPAEVWNRVETENGAYLRGAGVNAEKREATAVSGGVALLRTIRRQMGGRQLFPRGAVR
ncbi:ABC transporter ATP-binding protein [Timonella senegalensis]|uniref:ABC transporter ATP-binding protein n=1 Tax=Timonella senegalensis TaxID=1465825 RepID=UPI002FDCD0C7